MAYTKHTWVSNEVISATLLNHIEEGIEAAQNAADAADAKAAKAKSQSAETAALELTITQLQAEIRKLQERVTTLEA